MATAPRAGAILAIISAVVGIRILGVSALLPVFAPYGFTLSTSGLLVGIALSGYALTTALMQTPMGSLSDRFGRKRILLIGLTTYIFGNVAAWQAEAIADATGLSAIGVLIAARLFEGIGAVSSVGIALVADVTDDDKRTFSMALIGIGAGGSFLLGVVAGPLLAPLIGVEGIFLVSAILGLLVWIAILVIVPSDRALAAYATAQAAAAPPVIGPVPGFWATLRDPRGLRADVVAFTNNLALISVLFVLPLLVRDGANAFLDDTSYKWTMIVMVLIGGTLIMGASRGADKRNQVGRFAMTSALMLGIGAIGLLTVSWVWLYVLVGVLFFGGHGGLSATMPNIVSRLFSKRRRGTAIGGLNSSAYMGSFVGGPLAGFLYERSPMLIGFLVLAMTLLSAYLLSTLRGRIDGGAPSQAGPGQPAARPNT